MSKSRQADSGVLVRFWSLDHHRPEPIVWPVSEWPKLVYAAAGALQVQSRERVYVLPPNRAIWIEPGERHPAETLGRAQVRTLFFASNVVRPVGILEVNPLLKELISEACRCGPLFGGTERHEALHTLLKLEVESAASLPAGIQMPVSDLLRDWAARFLRYPLEWPEAPISRRTLERRMLFETGLTLGQWTRQARAHVGLRALSTGATVQEAAIEAGFATSSGFIQSFKSQFGATPRRVN